MIVLKIYNTLTRQLEEFVPLDKNKVRMYVCGVTTYDYSHIGHARSYVAFDVIRRYLEYKGYKVKYVQNFTDVDDKIINRARELNVPPLELAEKFIQEYFRDMDALGIKRAEVYPRATEHIGEIVAMVQELVKKYYAYAINGDVYFRVSKAKNYGKLAGQDIEELKAGARVEVDERKENPLDFALWKSAKEGEIYWESPWGHGRPGWHIECSAMSTKHLGATLDIHGGGQDLIFPHHENEIQQSESFSGAKFVRYWLHNGFVTARGEKMSKSLGNFVTIRELFKKYDAEAIRFFLLTVHYRKPLDFDEVRVEEARAALERIYNSIYNAKNALRHADEGSDEFAAAIDTFKRDFISAMDEDFNVPQAIAALFNFVRELNKYIENKPKKDSTKKAIEAIYELGDVVGFDFERKISPLVEQLANLLIELRNTARQRKDYKTSDEIRDRLRELGVDLEDQKDGSTRWKFGRT